jgi:TatA/E family protein of Tat protein translocase
MLLVRAQCPSRFGREQVIGGEMPHFGVWELLIILVIVLLIFGATRLKDIGKGLGGAVTAFRTEVKQGRENTDEKAESES